MALPANLTNNEVKNHSGVEIEFLRQSTGPGRETVFAQSGEPPGRPYRITVKHSETGAGESRRRRSVLRVDYTFVGEISALKTAQISGYIVLDAPIGNMTGIGNANLVLANLTQLLATQGAAETTVRLDGTGYGQQVLAKGEL